MENNEQNYFRPKTWVSFVIMAFLVAAMCSAIFLTGQQLHITMLTCMGFCILMLVLTGCPYSKIEEAIISSGNLTIPTLIILYTIGAVMGSWIASGTVPMIIYWGLKLISPGLFLTTACIACMITAMATGSSWSTIGTVGVALMGVGMGLNMNPAMTAGAIVSGAAFGDKMSPMSDTTNVAPAVAGADLFDHIKAMVTTGGPAIVIALVGFTVMGMSASGDANSETIAQILDSLNSIFHLNLTTLIPLILVLALAIMKFPAFPTLLISALVAAAMAILAQGQSIPSIMSIMENGFVSETGFYDIDKLLSRGGMFSMHYTASLTVIVMAFGGILEKCGVLDEILSKMRGLTRTVGTMVCTTVVIEILLNLVTASQYMTIILGGKLMMPVYKEKDMLPQCLSRTLEDSGTVTSLLIPWNLCGAFASAALGVGCFTYLPFALFNWICPLIAVVWGFTGLFQWKTGQKPSKKTYRPVDSEAPVSK
ncbi:Na+/H+ antiporter NhaC [Oscillibacter sp. MSJ-2]|uniref:Na+/H+ antiporter NhaC n=1 Tax=Dysosmobacter acutus TaxID=2841504 RepID=A0ABS6F9K9_9FIRM|nr:Na+/H+ antiporter NhaC [Dysosmobacter acutus]MBU5626862.1 Na+/H+ antiporter NhaC [Dysosmobacter acutus]